MTLQNTAHKLVRMAARLRRELQPPSPAELATLPRGATPDDFLPARRAVAATFLRGDGIEIGALQHPLPVPPAARVRYVDRLTRDDLVKQYPDLTSQPLVHVDIVDDGERLSTIASGTQDFVIANHFLEHCENPILTLQNLVRVLKAGGVLYLAVPDKRFTFDIDRPSTPLDHLMRDYTEGPAWSRRQHFEEWIRLVIKCSNDVEVQQHVDHLMAINYSIHFHVWRAAELAELVTAMQRFVTFELELFLRNGFESIVVLRRSGG